MPAFSSFKNTSRSKSKHDVKIVMPKRKSEDAESSERNEQQGLVKVKMEPPSTDYSEDVKKKLNTASRTSTACDRCRIRKMRCDDDPQGCAPCRQNQTECKTTDRITGKATVRGYVESLERRIQEIESYNRQLQVRIVSLGGDVPVEEIDPDPSNGSTSSWQGSHESNPFMGHQVYARVGADEQSDGRAEPANFRAYQPSIDSNPSLPKFRSGLTGNNYLGVSTGDSLLSSIRGTSMNVLGMEIDIADYTSPDLDEPEANRLMGQPLYNKSYGAFIQTAFGAAPRLSNIKLPPRQQGIEQVDAYFRGLNPFLPILHRPTFMNTFTRMYDDPSFQPTIAETATVHAVIAIMHCQIATRAALSDEQRADLQQSSNLHYHYALGHFSQLMAGHTLPDVQALAVLAMWARSLPKPGACWMLISITFNLAIELGLHRSVKSWAATSKRPSPLEIEVRKRVFWGIVVLYVTVSGNLGRPLALRSEDCDVEMPEAVDDDLLNHNGMDCSRTGTCNFLVGLEGMRLMPIMIDIYNSIYTVKRSPQNYVDTVRGLERRIKDWVDQWPQEIRDQSANEKDPNHVHAQWLQTAPLHMRLLLRHPSLSLTSNAAFNAENLTICLELSRKMLKIVRQLQKFQCLDGTWQTSALYVLAISTTLFAHWERKDSITSEDMAFLKEEMGSWLSIIGEMGQLLGSGRMLQDAVRTAIEKTIKSLSQYLISKNVAPGGIQPPSQSRHAHMPAAPVQHSAPMTFQQPGFYPSFSTPENAPSSNGQPQVNGQAAPYMPPPGSLSIAYQDPSQFAYANQYSASPTSYEPRTFNQSSNLPPSTSAAATAYMGSYSQAQAPYSVLNTFSNNPAYQQHGAGSPSSWRDFTGSITGNIDPSTADYMSSASALMQLGRSDETQNQQQQDLQVGIELQQNHNMNPNHAQTWPFY